MARTIKRISHDLNPLAGAAVELSVYVNELLTGINSHIEFDDPKAKEYFDECRVAVEKLVSTTGYIRTYVLDVDKEADAENILKD